MKAKNVLFRRSHVCAWLYVVALGGLSLATDASATSVATSSSFQGFMARVTGANATTVSIGGGGQLVASTPSAALGGTSGWSRAANFGVGSTSSGLAVGMSGTATVAGKAVPITLNSPITKAAVAAGFGRLIGMAAGVAPVVSVAAMLLLPEISAYLSAADVGVNTDPATRDAKPFTLSGNGQVCSIVTPGNTPYTNCANGNTCQVTPFKEQRPGFPTQCQGGWVLSDGQRIVTTFGTWGTVTGPRVPANWDEVRPAFESMATLPSTILQAQIDLAKKLEGKNGIEPWFIDVGTPTVTAPASSPQETSTVKTTTVVTGPDGRPQTVETTTTKTTTNPVTVTGDTVKVTPTTTTQVTTKTTDADGVVTHKTDTSTETASKDTPDKESDLCKANPDILACSKPELDTPTGEIPRDNETINYQEENLFAFGSCPADVMALLGTTGKTVKVWDWQKTCQYALPLRAIVLSLATFAAFLIVMPGETRV